MVSKSTISAFLHFSKDRVNYIYQYVHTPNQSTKLQGNLISLDFTEDDILQGIHITVCRISSE